MADKKSGKATTNNDSLELDNKTTEALIETLIKSLYINGAISKEDLIDKDKLFKKVLLLIKKAGTIDFVVDHKDSILHSAKNYFNEKEYDFSAIFFSIYFEHSINSIISFCLEMKGTSQKTKKDILRSMGTYPKFTWVLQILGLPKIKEDHLKTILKISEARNAFVHYKYSPVEDDIEKSEKLDRDLIDLLKRAHKSVTYMKMYESKIMFKDKKKEVDRKIKQLLKK